MSLQGLFLAPWRLRDLGRVRRIAGVLVRHGFADVAVRLGWPARLRAWTAALLRRPPPEIEAVPIETRIRRVLEELGPTFIKFGQVLATRPDLLPMSLVLELKRLHDHVTPFPFDEVRATVEEDLRRPIREVFESFEEEPIASASIAQVHRARLQAGVGVGPDAPEASRDVVVKVQRPHLRDVVQADLRILAGVAALLERRFPEIRPFRPRALVEEFRRSLNRETDFLSEMHAMVRYKRMFADEPRLFVPEPVPALCTRRVLVMERVDGVKVTDVGGLRRLGVDLGSLVEVGMRVTMRSIFEFGFFHADPHPGNFFIRPDGTIVLLDFGMMGSIEPERLDELLTYLVALVTGDVEMMVAVLADADLIGDDTDVHALRGDLRAILDRWSGSSIGAIDLSSFLAESVEVARRHHVVLPADLLLVGKAIAIMEGIGREVHPEFEPLAAVRPLLTELYVRRALDARRHSQALLRTVLDGAHLLREAPHDLRRILRKVRRGEMAIQVQSLHEEARQRGLHARTNRLVFGFLFPTFFFGGTYLIGTESSLQNLAGLVSFGIAGLCFMGLAISMLQSDGR